MRLFLAATPDRISDLTVASPAQIVCAAYRIGAGSRLLASPIPTCPPSGLIMLCDRDAPAVNNPDRLCREITGECIRRRCGGAVLDFEDAPTADRIALIRRLDALFFRQNLTLYVPESYGDCIRHAAVLICTALSGGTLRDRLQEAAARFAPCPIALDCQRLAMDFLIPSPSGEGVPLTPRQLRQLRQGRSVFFSEDLCARYFTYRTAANTHFVLFDDGETLRRKVQLGREIGAAASFFMLPEVADLSGELFSPA